MQQHGEILRIATEQGGVVRRDQAVHLGFTRHQIDGRVSSDRWSVVSAGGYRLIEMPGRLSLARAACAILPDATVSHHSAAALHKLKAVPRDIVSVSVHTSTTHDFPDVIVHRNSDLPPEHLTLRQGLKTTSVARTLMDLSGVLSARRTEYVVDEALAEGACTITELEDVLSSVARRGKPGVATMRAILGDRSSDSGRMSQLERGGLSILRRAGFEGFELEFAFPWDERRRFDVAFPLERVAIEWDSIRWHTQKTAFRTDRERDRLAIEHGWIVLRFTWQDVFDDPISVESSIRTVLAARLPR